MPSAPPPVVAPRRASRQLLLRHDRHPVLVGGDAPVSVQSMATTVTADVNSTLQQIAELTAAGCQVVRVAVPSQDDAEALPIIAKKSGIPVIADIHFQPKYVFAALDAGCAGVRVNPGNIKQFDDKVGVAPFRRLVVVPWGHCAPRSSTTLPGGHSQDKWQSTSRETRTPLGTAISGPDPDEPLRGRSAAAVDPWLPRRRDDHGRGCPGRAGWGSRRWA